MKALSGVIAISARCGWSRKRGKLGKAGLLPFTAREAAAPLSQGGDTPPSTTAPGTGHREATRDHNGQRRGAGTARFGHVQEAHSTSSQQTPHPPCSRDPLPMPHRVPPAMSHEVPIAVETLL